MPTQQQVDAYLPPFEPRQILDPKEPVSIGAMVGPEAFTEVRYLAHAKQMRRSSSFPAGRTSFAALSAAKAAAFSMPHRGCGHGGRGPRLGARHDQGHGRRNARARRAHRRPWNHLLPALARDAVQQALARAKRVIVLEKSLAVGIGGIVSTNVRTACDVPIYTVIAGLGGRPITRASLAKVFGAHPWITPPSSTLIVPWSRRCRRAAAQRPAPSRS